MNAAPIKFPCAFRTELQARIQQGSHLVLYGPRGVGKSTLIQEFAQHYRSVGMPCGVAACTSALPDIVAALAEAYPDTNIDRIGRKAARMRLRSVADGNPGVLLLDHATNMTTQMLGYLRRLRGGIAGALLAVDVDSAREREGLRDWHAGALSIRMQAMPNVALDEFLVEQIQVPRMRSLDPRVRRQLVRSARGRIGWITECVRRLRTPEYWADRRLHLATLCMDTEIAIRESRVGPRSARLRKSAINKPTRLPSDLRTL
jgi:GTPase SAR1 family protein